MAVTFVQAAVTASAATSGETVTIPKPSGATTGNLMIAFISSRAVHDVATGPSGWTLIVERDAPSGSTSGNRSTCTAYWKFVQPGDPASWTMTFTSSKNYRVAVVELAGAHATTPIDTFWSGDNGSSTTFTWNGVTVANNGSMLVGGTAQVTSAETQSAPAGAATATTRWDGDNAASGAAASTGWTAPVNAGATGNYTQTWSTVGGTASNALILIAVAPASTASEVTATLQASWGSWSAAAAFKRETPAVLQASWGSWTAHADFTVDSPEVEAVFQATWGSWSANAAFTVESNLPGPASVRIDFMLYRVALNSDIFTPVTVVEFPADTTTASTFTLLYPDASGYDWTDHTVTFEIARNGFNVASVACADVEADDGLGSFTFPALTAGTYTARFVAELDGDLASFPTVPLTIKVVD